MSDTTPHAEPPSIERAIDALDACSKAFLQFRATFDLMTGHYEPETLEANSEAWDRIWESIEKEFDKLAQAVTAVHEDKRQYTQNIAEVDVVKERYNQRIWGTLKSFQRAAMTLAQASHEEQLECYFEKLVAEFVSACASTPDVTQAVIVEGECRSSLMRMKEMERQHQARIEEAAEAYQILQRTLESKDDQNNKLQARNAELEGKIERIQQELFGGGHPERGTNDRSQDNAPDELNVVNNIRPQPKKHGGGRPRKVKKTRPPGAGRQPKMIES